MSVSRPDEDTFAAVRTRHRLIVTAGAAGVAAGVALAAFIAYEWFVRSTSHEVLAVVSAAAVLFGLQLLVLATLTDMLIALHREQLHRFDAGDPGDDG